MTSWTAAEWLALWSIIRASGAAGAPKYLAWAQAGLERARAKSPLLNDESTTQSEEDPDD